MAVTHWSVSLTNNPTDLVICLVQAQNARLALSYFAHRGQPDQAAHIVTASTANLGQQFGRAPDHQTPLDFSHESADVVSHGGYPDRTGHGAVLDGGELIGRTVQEAHQRPHPVTEARDFAFSDDVTIDNVSGASARESADLATTHDGDVFEDDVFDHDVVGVVIQDIEESHIDVIRPEDRQVADRVTLPVEDATEVIAGKANGLEIDSCAVDVAC